MRQSKINIVKELNKQLMKIHHLANLVEQKHSEGSTSFRSWLFETEEIMTKHNLPQVSQLATLRAELANYIPKAKHKRKDFFNYVARLLSQAQDDVWQTCELFNQKTQQATDLVKQLITLVAQAKVLKFEPHTDFTAFLENIWLFCNRHEQLKSITIQILSLINKSDVLLIMAEEIDLNDF